MEDHHKTCIVISGPTAVGKTGLSLNLAGFFNAPVLSFDSRQCYRELNIGVAKPTVEELQSASHYFINSHSITEEVNAAEYARYAEKVAAQVFTQHDTLIMVGGTGLYLNAFLDGLDEMPEIDESIRSELRAAYDIYGMEWLRGEIIKADPLFSQLQNPQRMLRALEVMKSTGTSVTTWQRSEKKARNFQVIKLALDLDRQVLYDRINFRVDQMIQQGLLEEAGTLISYKNLNALNTVGYKELFEVIAGNASVDEGIAAIKQHTRNYAKRQLTWFRRDPAYAWFHPAQTNEIKNYCIKSAAK